MQKGSNRFRFFQFLWLTSSLKLLLTTIYSFMFLFRTYQPSACWKSLFHPHELVSIENFSSWEIKAWSCQWVVNQHWRVCEPKVKKFWKVKVEVRVHFQQKWRAEQKQELKKTLAISSLKHLKTRSDIFYKWQFSRGQKKILENFLGMLLRVKEKL